MSAYKVIECAIQSSEHILAGLIDMGIPREDIEIYEEPSNLFGYVGDKRSEKANIIIRRKTVNKYISGGSSNDIGFEKVGDQYKAHVSNYDMRYWKRKEPRFLQVTACETIQEKARKKGYTVKKSEVNGKIKLKLIKNY